MTSVTIFGSGNMGSAIDEVLTAGGATVDHIGSADPPGPVNGDIVILAVYHTAFRDIVDSTATSWPARSLSTSRTRWTLETLTRSFRLLTARPPRILPPLPSSLVLKAFNTNLAPTLSAKKVGPNTTTVLVAGDDTDAKAALISAVQAGGLDALDTGPLARARELEALGFLQIKLAVTEQIGWTGGFAVLR